MWTSIELAPLTCVAIASMAIAGGVIETEDREEWIDTVGAFDFIDFVGFPNEYLFDQFVELGVLFTDGNDSTFFNQGFLDDYGAYGGLFHDVGFTMAFDEPRLSIGLDYPGRIQFQLFRGGELVLESSLFRSPGEIGFAGLISTEPFDTAIVHDPAGDTDIDNVYFDPAPCAGDLDRNGEIGFSEVLFVLVAWGSCPDGHGCPEDRNRDGFVDFADVLSVLSAWGPCE